MPETEISQSIAPIPERPLPPPESFKPLRHDGAAPGTASGGVVAAGDEPAYICARRLEQVRTAWSLVYERYVGKALIDENPFGIHTVQQAVGEHSCVIYGSNGDSLGSTMTLIGDNKKGLPLDSVYAKKLNALRWRDRALVEVGLLADRRRSGRRGARALFDLMRWAVYYTLHIGSTDIVIGVHPRHARFYIRCFGFDCFARPTVYPLVNDNPVVPLRLRLREMLTEASLPRGLAHIRDNPVAGGEFSQRFGFKPEQLRGSTIERFLQSRHGTVCAPEKAAIGSALCDAVLPTVSSAGLRPA